MPNLIPMRDLGREKAIFSWLMNPIFHTPDMIERRRRNAVYLASHIATERANNSELANLSDSEMTSLVNRMPPHDKLVLACTTKDGQEIYTCESVLTAHWRQHPNDYTGAEW
jgi:hypothetical protein